MSAGVAGSTTNTETKTKSIITTLAEMSGSIQGGLGALGAAVGVGLIGMGASEAVGRNPGASTKILIQAILSTAFAEGIVFFALFLGK
jgi:F-type H+-transporting ATPase subunit c